MAMLSSSFYKKKKLNSALSALNGFKEFSVALGMGAEGAEHLAKDIRSVVGPSVDDIRIRRIVVRATQIHDSLESITRFRAELLSPFRHLTIALVVVDFQNDFVTGSLSIKKGPSGEDPRDAIPALNDLLRENTADVVVYTMDWHPANHISFYEHCRNGDRRLSEEDKSRKLKPFDVVRFSDPECAQVLYPTHCVHGSWGANIDPLVHVVKDAHFIKKGQSVLVDSYSAFQDNAREQKTSLEAFLREKGVDAVIGCGLAYEICVAATLKDAADLGFFTAIVADASKGLDNERIRETNDEFYKKKIAVLSAGEAMTALRKDVVPIEWIEKRLDDLLQD
ncbi:hypothetical protein PENTCL1PPCAC_18347 [Pristionchus entomophagus]|uniref:nicotinamidase n=1 Tax=Pristionchus entomophagus TaxID=358040 RepID=A0AAV5TPJ4_9BILA|nr:hypothetical protein PENTCL1PPCAC_18347 [Pristionchus entomophagus]